MKSDRALVFTTVAVKSVELGHLSSSIEAKLNGLAVFHGIRGPQPLAALLEFGNIREASASIRALACASVSVATVFGFAAEPAGGATGFVWAGGLVNSRSPN
jgi:hypothetical protein